MTFKPSVVWVDTQFPPWPIKDTWYRLWIEEKHINAFSSADLKVIKLLSMKDKRNPSRSIRSCPTKPTIGRQTLENIQEKTNEQQLSFSVSVNISLKTSCDLTPFVSVHILYLGWQRMGKRDNVSEVYVKWKQMCVVWRRCGRQGLLDILWTLFTASVQSPCSEEEVFLVTDDLMALLWSSIYLLKEQCHLNHL